MTERKFTDEEVINALKCCSKDDSKDCDACPYEDMETRTYCANELIKDTLELINRKQSEVASLKKTLHELKMEAKMVYKQRDVLKNQVDTQKAEIERLEEENRGFSICLDSAVKTALKIKSEAIKEFWNELKSRNTLDYRIVSTITGDNLVKELTEENKGQAVSV